VGATARHERMYRSKILSRRRFRFSNEGQPSAHGLIMCARPIQTTATGTLRKRGLRPVYVRRNPVFVIFLANQNQDTIAFETSLEGVRFYVQPEVPGHRDELLERVLGTDYKYLLRLGSGGELSVTR